MSELVHFLDLGKGHPARTSCGIEYQGVGTKRMAWTQVLEDVTCVECRAGWVDDQLARLDHSKAGAALEED